MTGRAIARQTYAMFAKKYKIKLGKTVKNKWKRKTLKELQYDIYNYEINNNVSNGLYFHTIQGKGIGSSSRVYIDYDDDSYGTSRDNDLNINELREEYDSFVELLKVKIRQTSRNPYLNNGLNLIKNRFVKYIRQDNFNQRQYHLDDALMREIENNDFRNVPRINDGEDDSFIELI